MATESAGSSRSDGNNSAMVPKARPLMAADLFLAAVKGNSDVLCRSLGLPAEEQHLVKVTVDDAPEHKTREIDENNVVVQDKIGSATPFGDTVLHILVANKHTHLALKVFEKENSLLKARNRNLETPLHCAAKVGNGDIFEKFPRTLLKDGLEETNKDGDTVLHLAVKNGHANVVKELLEINRELVYKINQAGLSPLHIAIVQNQHYSIFELILRTDISLASTQFLNGSFPVHVAASVGNTSLILFLFKTNSDYVSLLDPNGRNFFHIAADENINEVFTKKVLTNKGADVMLTNKDYEGNTPLHHAVRKGNEFIVEAIVKCLRKHKKCSFKREKNNKGQTPRDISKIRRRKKQHENIWERVQVIGLGAVLITTISFAAAFTFPGGYDQNTGAPVLGKDLKFQAFIAGNAMTFLASFVSVYLLVTNDSPSGYVIRRASAMFYLAAILMLITFGVGTYLVLASVDKLYSNLLFAAFMLFGIKFAYHFSLKWYMDK